MGCLRSCESSASSRSNGPRSSKPRNKPAPHVSEILEVGFKIAHCAVVLLTPDDEARVRDEFRLPDDPEYEWKLSPQPRPNVLFEAGMAMAHFPDRTVLCKSAGIARSPTSQAYTRSGRQFYRETQRPGQAPQARGLRHYRPQLEHRVADRCGFFGREPSVCEWLVDVTLDQFQPTGTRGEKVEREARVTLHDLDDVKPAKL
jgi:Predicted nucleotide-binding protein containing TIR-like domain